MKEKKSPEVSEKEKKKTRRPADARSLARELAMQFLFQRDFSDRSQDSRVLAYFWKQLKDAKCFPENRVFRRACEFAEQKINSVEAKLAELDSAISKRSKNWKIERMNSVDRNLLRLGAYEILFDEKIPPLATISEILRLADKYGSEESKNFVNGILHSIAVDSGRKLESQKKKK